MAPDTDVADITGRIKRALSDQKKKSNTGDPDEEFYRGLLNITLKLLDASVSSSDRFSWSWLGPDYAAPVIFACVAIVVKWLEERLAKFLMKKFNIRMPSIYFVIITNRHFL